MNSDRLDKILAGSGHYTRAQARAAIRSGAVTVDGAAVRRPEEKVSRGARIVAEGRPIDGAEHVYCMMNKPADTICATEDGAYPAVTNLLPRHLRARGLFPVGRLDADVTGLLLLTDDGAFAHRVTAPRSEIEKVYEVYADGPLTGADRDLLAAGVSLPDGTCYRPAKLIIDSAEPRRGLVTVTEGKYHEVKNLLAACGRRVQSMRRLRIGALELDQDLELGAIRMLGMEEIDRCFQKFI